MSEADAERLGPQPRLEDNSFTGLTVGVVPVENAGVAALLSRLRGLEMQACELGWITSAAVCHSLQVKLDQAARAVERSQTQGAKGHLQSFLNELAAQHGPEPGKHVTDNAYWLLKVNAEFLLTKL